MALTAGFETGINGNTVSVSDAGDANKLDSVSIAATCSITYDRTHAALGSLSAKLVQGGTPGLTTVGWQAQFGSQTDHYGRIYVYQDAINSSGAMSLMFVRRSGSLVARIYLNSTGTLSLTDSTGGAAATTTATVVLHQWVRIEYHVIHNAATGFLELKLFNRPYSDVPTETISASNKNTGANGDQIDIGQFGANTTGDTMWLDQLVVAAAAYPGPVPTLLQPGQLGMVGGIR